jgi:hypothetical protein
VIKSRRMKWAGHVALTGDRRSAYRVFVGKFKEKIPVGRPRIRWKNSNKMDVQGVE